MTDKSPHENLAARRLRLTTFAMRLAVTLLVAMAFPALQASAGEIYYLSQPGLCNAGDGVLEEPDAIVLTDRSIGNHYFNCSFKRPIGTTLSKEHWVKTEARCENGTGNWMAAFEIVSQDDGGVNVFQKSGGLSPVRFYRCDD